MLHSRLILALALLSFQGWAQGSATWERERVVAPEVWHFPVGIRSEYGASGNLSVSVPLMTIPGRGGLDYNLELKYSAGITTRQAASWVGLGWTLDPGSVVRLINILPDGKRVVKESGGSYGDFPDFYRVSIPEMSSMMYQMENDTLKSVNFKIQSGIDWQVMVFDSVFTGLRTIGNQSTHEDATMLGFFIDNDPYHSVAQGARQLTWSDFKRFVILNPDGRKYVFDKEIRSEEAMGDILIEYISNWSPIR